MSEAEDFYFLGLALEQLGRLTEAKLEFYEVLRLQPNHPEAHYHLGCVLAKTGFPEKAEKEFVEVLRLKPDCVGAHYHIGLIRWDCGSVAAAERAFHESLRLDPDFAPGLEKLAAFLDHQGRSEEAYPYWARSWLTETDPGVIRGIKQRLGEYAMTPA
jgi:tetratricopeptide (TPR) repeat protein